MPPVIPGATKVSLTDRVRAFLNPRQPNLSTVSFGPGTPIEPTPITPDQTPRQFGYDPGVNLSLTPRREYPRLALTPFEQLRQLARFYDVASICIETRINWMVSAGWSVTARDKRKQAELQPICNEIERFFRKPDGVQPFPTWLRAALLDQLEIDALTIYKQRDMLGRLIGLKLIDGSTIKPLLNALGETAAYQQILYGYVRGEYAQPGMPAPDQWPSGGDLLYLPRWTSTDSPYGRSPTEQIILRINMAIRKETMDLGYFTDGNDPRGFMSPAGDMKFANPEQVRQFEDAYNADLQGVTRARNQIKFMPWDGKFQEMKPFSYSTEIDNFMLEIACAAYHIPKIELGMTDKANKATSEAQENVAFRHAVEPDAFWLKTVLLDPIIHEDFGRPDLQWSWDFGETEDQAKIAGVQQADITAGVISADESRRLRYPDLDGKAPGPPAAPMPLDKIWRDGLPANHPSKQNEAAEVYLTLMAQQLGITDKDGTIGDALIEAEALFRQRMAPHVKAIMQADWQAEEDAILGKAETTVDLDTNLVADDRAPKRKRKRGKRKAVDVAALIEGESAGALDWAKKASEGE